MWLYQNTRYPIHDYADSRMEFSMKDYDFDKIGTELKRLRRANSYTQEQVANELGCTIAFISNIENNRTKINLRVLTLYARLFHVTVDSILNAGQDHMAIVNTLSPLEEEALCLLQQFSPPEQEKIIKILKYIREAASEN